MKDIVSFIQQTREELEKVTWPTKKEVLRLTMIVMLSSVIVGIYLGGIDYLFTKLLGLIIR